MQDQIELIYKLMELSQKIKPYPSEIKVIKLMEEVGELSECITKLSGYKTNDESKEEIMLELWKEICDIFIMIVSLGKEYSLPLDKFKGILQEKIDKWWNKHLKQYITDPKDIPAEYDSPDGKRVEPLKPIIAPFETTFIGDDLDSSKQIPGWLKDQAIKREDRSDCLHDNCEKCKGTGIDAFGQSCIHMMSCRCKKCAPYGITNY